MITFISNSGESCPIAHQMQREGYRVQIYLHHPSYKDSFENILSVVKLSELPAAIRKSRLVIMDHIRPHCGLKRDRALLRVFNCDPESKTVFGPVAEKIRRRGIKLIGGSYWTEQLELDRQFGSEVAKQIGFSAPVTYDFDRLSEARKFLEGKHSLWVLKPHANLDLDLTYVETYPGELEYRLRHDIPDRLKKDKIPIMVQKKIEGTALSTEGWFNGEDFALFNHTYEDKSLMCGGLGPHIGSQSNTVWTRELRQDITNKLGSLSPLLKQAGYVGPIDVNCLIASKNDRPYFLEWTPRLGYDALFILLSMLEGQVGEFFLNHFEPSVDSRYYGCSQRLSIPPYPYEEDDLLRRARGVEVREPLESQPKYWWQDIRWSRGILQCAGADGIIGIAVGKGFSIGEAANAALRNAEEAKIGGYKQYRLDQKERAHRAFEAIGLGKIGVS